MRAARTTFTVDTPIFGWVFMTIWHQFAPPIEAAIMLFFWVGGSAGAGYLFSIPRIKLTVENDDVTITEKWLWRSATESFRRQQLTMPVLTETKDSEGDPYFQCSIRTPAGRTVIFAEHNQRRLVEAERDRLAALIG